MFLRVFNTSYRNHYMSLGLSIKGSVGRWVGGWLLFGRLDGWVGWLVGLGGWLIRWCGFRLVDGWVGWLLVGRLDRWFEWLLGLGG